MSTKPWKRTTVPVYGGKLLAYRDRAHYIAALQAHGVELDEEDENALGRCVRSDESDGSVVYVLGWFDRSRATLVHEVCHLALFVLNRAGIDPNDSSGEALCYLLDSLYGKLDTARP